MLKAGLSQTPIFLFRAIIGAPKTTNFQNPGQQSSSPRDRGNLTG